MDGISDIEHLIDNILNKPYWGEKETDFYNLLKKKVKQYSIRKELYELNLEKADIISNIHEQGWFINSKHKFNLNEFLNEMEIKEYNKCAQQQLTIAFPKSKFFLKFTVGKDIFHLYLEDFDGINRAFIAYNDRNDSLHIGNIKLPQRGAVLKIAKVDNQVSGIELLKLFSEIVLYYDQTIIKINIGINTPISLEYILTKL
jgi:hypothetical protein